jgi:hypothetical protein
LLQAYIVAAFLAGHAAVLNTVEKIYKQADKKPQSKPNPGNPGQ